LPPLADKNVNIFKEIFSKKFHKFFPFFASHLKNWLLPPADFFLVPEAKILLFAYFFGSGRKKFDLFTAFF
jgi:hypothetical protein